MAEQDDFYSPVRVDEQIEYFLQSDEHPTRDQRMLQDLQALLIEDEDTQSLNRVLHKLHTNRGDAPQENSKLIPIRFVNQGRTKPLTQVKNRPFVRAVSLLAACFVLVIVIGSFLLVLNAARQNKNVSNQPASTITAPTKTPTPTEEVGKIVWKSDEYIMDFGTQWSPDGKRIASVLNRTTLTSWDAKSGAHKITYKTPGEMLLGYTAWSPDGKLLAVAGKKTIYVFDAQSGQRVKTLIIPNTTASNAPGAMTNTDATQQKGFLNSRITLSGGDLIDKMIWSPDGRYIVASYHNMAPSSIFIWNAEDGTPAKTLGGFPSSITDISWSPDGSSLAVLTFPANRDGVQPTAQIWNVSDWSVAKEYPNVQSLSWSPDGKRLALVDADFILGKDVRIVNARSGQKIKQLIEEGRIDKVHWSPDGSRIMVEYMNKIQILDATNGSLLYTFSQSAYNGAWSPDGNYIVCSQSVEHTDPKTMQPYFNGSLLIWRAK